MVVEAGGEFGEGFQEQVGAVVLGLAVFDVVAAVVPAAGQAVGAVGVLGEVLAGLVVHDKPVGPIAGALAAVESGGHP